MLARCFLLILFAVVSLMSCNHVRHRPPRSQEKTEVLHCDNCSCVMSEPLLKLLTTLHVDHKNSLDSVVKETQRSWLRPKGVERFDMRNSYATTPSLTPLLRQMGLVDAIFPQAQHYRYALVYGANASVMKKRLDFLARIAEQGVTFDNLVFLGSARPTTSEEKLSGGATETEILRSLLAKRSLPQSLAKSRRLIVDTPMKVLADGTITRPNTADTIIEWLSSSPEPGSVLAISNQPYVQYQHAVLKTYIPSSFCIETVGPKDGEPMSVHLDNIARILYQEQQWMERCTR